LGEATSVDLRETASVGLGETASVDLGEATSVDLGETVSVGLEKAASVGLGETTSIDLRETASVGWGETASVTSLICWGITTSIGDVIEEKRSAIIGEGSAILTGVGAILVRVTGVEDAGAPVGIDKSGVDIGVCEIVVGSIDCVDSLVVNVDSSIGSSVVVVGDAQAALLSTIIMNYHTCMQ